MERHREASPRSPILFTAVLAALAVLGIGTGVADILLPAIRGERSFQALESLVLTGAPAAFSYLFLHVFIHNLGIACLVPGIGLVAARYERCPANRRLIGPLLAGAVALSLATALYWIWSEGAHRDGEVLTFFTLELAGVAILAHAGLQALRRYEPSPHAAASFEAPANHLAPRFLAAGLLIATGAFIEVCYVARTVLG